MAGWLAVTAAGTLLTNQAQILRLSSDFQTAIVANTNNDAVSINLAPQANVTAGTYSAVTVNGAGVITRTANLVATGDATGTAVGATIALTLANSGVVTGNYNTVTVNAKGLITAASNTSYLTGNQSITLTGDATGTGSNSIAVTLANSGVTAGTFSAISVNSKGLAVTGVNMTITGDVTGTSAGAGLALTLAAIGTAGGYTSVTTDTKGRVIAGSNIAYLPLTGGTLSGPLIGTSFNAANSITAGNTVITGTLLVNGAASLTGVTTAVTPPVNDASNNVATTNWVVINSANTKSISNIYSASGAITPSDSFCLVNASTTVAMTLATNTVDGHQIAIKRWGSGFVTITAMIDGMNQTVNMTSGSVKESIQLVWSNAFASYILI